MVYLGTRDGPDPKCYFTSSVLSNFVNHEQIPTKKKPFSTISTQPFSHTVVAFHQTIYPAADQMSQLSLVLPKSDAETLKQTLSDVKGTLQYAKVYMTLGDLIEGDFFNHYIKTGEHS